MRPRKLLASGSVSEGRGSAHVVSRKKRREETRTSWLEKASSLVCLDRIITPVVFISIMYCLHRVVELSSLLEPLKQQYQEEKHHQADNVELHTLSSTKSTHHNLHFGGSISSHSLENNGEPISTSTNTSSSIPSPPTYPISQVDRMWCYEEDGIEYCLPQVIGVCCVSSGSTALSEYLNAHPFLSYGIRKEHHAFRFQVSSLDQIKRNRKWNTELALSNSRYLKPGDRQFVHGPYPGKWGITSSNHTTSYNEGNYFMPPFTGEGDVLVQFKGRVDKRKFAKEFPDRTGGLRPIRFDFDPTYLNSYYSTAPFHALHSLLGQEEEEEEQGHLDTSQTLEPSIGSGGSSYPNYKLLYIFRNPAYQACRRLAPQAPNIPNIGALLNIIANITNLNKKTKSVVDLGYHNDSASNSQTPPLPSPFETSFESQFTDLWKQLLTTKEKDKFENETIYDKEEDYSKAFHWLHNLHSFCYVEHVERWIEEGAHIEHMHFVKSEELRNSSTREKVVLDVLEFTGATDRLKSLKHRVKMYDNSTMKILDNQVDEQLEIFKRSLSDLHNEHKQAKPPPPLNLGDTSEGRDAWKIYQQSVVGWEAKEKLQQRCEQALNTPHSYIYDCNQRLSRLLKDEKWLWLDKESK